MQQLEKYNPLYSLRNRLFTFHNESLEERNIDELKVVKLRCINANIAQILFNKNPLDEEYMQGKLG